MRIALGIEYDGSKFFGWQQQRGAVRTVQNSVQVALSEIANEPIKVICAGRTDTGVHATAQVVHFETTAERPLHAWVLGSNSRLPDDVNVSWARSVPAAFHARYSATARSYCYTILNRDVRSALQRDRCAWIRRPLDALRMHRAAQVLVGEHDFSAFRAAGCQAKSPWRQLHEIRATRDGQKVLIQVEANAFLQHMVRNLAGALIAVGSGDREPDWLAEVLLARDRTLAGVTAPAEGLCLVSVRYPAEFELPRDHPHS